MLGLGVSGPQVVEGWYGQPSRNARSHAPVSTSRSSAVCSPATNPSGSTASSGSIPSPARAPRASASRSRPSPIPLRSDLPIFIGAEGPKNVAQTAQIADGWFPLYYSPMRPEVYADQLVDAPEDFEVVVGTTVRIADDVEAALAPTRATLAFYIGGMGAKGQNYHTKLMARMGFEAEALTIQELFLAGRRDEAIATVPLAFADEISLVGPPARIRDRLAAWEDSPVTTLNVTTRSVDELRQIAELVLG